jgi:hypothetical protein
VGDLMTKKTRFNIGEGQEENAIVTSTGQYVIAWDFAKVKKGQLDKYEIKKHEDLVVQDNFRFGDDKNIVRLPVRRSETSLFDRSCRHRSSLSRITSSA